MTDLSRERLHELYYYMSLTRSLEERLERLFKQGKIVGGLYRSLGQEAESVGAAYALGDGDWLGPGIRNLGAMLVRGVKPEEMLLQYMARGGAPTGGRDNTTHFSDPERGLVGPVSPLGTMICVLDGVGLSFRMRGEAQVVMTFIGDGGSRTGAAHEGINFAAVRHLPFVLIAEDNGWAFGTRTSEEMAIPDMVEMAAGYGVHGEKVDGNDVLAVYHVAREATERARSGGGMTIVEVKTYRMRGHAQHDGQSYVPDEELDAWRGRDPIDRYIAYLETDGLATADEIAAVDARVDSELDRAVEVAEAAPMPGLEAALADVYAGGPQPPPWARTL
jgi:pyruvate dehydrogenase E1 component alpha subunit/2-oxoisovalerate dehydrogenase E1 component alpha subunit